MSIQISAKNLPLDPAANDDMIRLPRAAKERLKFLSESNLPRLENLSGVLLKGGGREDQIIACARLEETLERASASRAALCQLPAALSRLEESLLRPPLSPPFENRSFRGEVVALINGVVNELANMAMCQRDLSVKPGFFMLGEGAYNWALTDFSSVVIVSKGKSTEAFDAFRLRHFCSGLLCDAGLEQPRIRSLSRLPVLHAIMDYAPGQTLSELWWQRFQSDSPENTVESFDRAIAKFGEFLRALSKIELEGYGRLRRSPDAPKFAGDYPTHEEYTAHLWRPLLAGDERDERITATMVEDGKFTAADVERFRGIAAKLESSDEPAVLGHSDPHSGNFLYDRQSDKLVALDWDAATSMTPTAQLARVFGNWIFYASAKEPAAVFERLLQAYEPDPALRAELRERVLDRVELECFQQASFALTLTGDPRAAADHARALQNYSKVQAVRGA